MKQISKFQKGSSTYTCQSCKKLTRDTGNDERAARLCVDCYTLAGIDNYLADNGIQETFENYGNEICDILDRRNELEDVFPDLVVVVGRRTAYGRELS